MLAEREIPQLEQASERRDREIYLPARAARSAEYAKTRHPENSPRNV